MTFGAGDVAAPISLPGSSGYKQSSLRKTLGVFYLLCLFLRGKKIITFKLQLSGVFEVVVMIRMDKLS